MTDKGNGTSGSGTPRRVDALGVITLLLSFSGAVLLYMGWSYLDGYFKLFHLEATDLGFGADDYILRGLNTFSPDFLPFMAAISLVLGGATYRSLLTRILPTRIITAGAALAQRRPVQIMSDPRCLGAVLTLGGIGSAIAVQRGKDIDSYLILSCVVIGPPLLAWPAREHTLGRIAFAWAAAVSVFCFLWMMNLHAWNRGNRIAEEKVRTLQESTSVVIYSKKTIALSAPNLSREVLPDSTYPYRYSGLRLLLAREGRYYLVPKVTLQEWNGGRARVIVMNEQEDWRLELLPGTVPY